MYVLFLTGSGSDIVIIPLTDDSCVYMFSFTGSGSHIVIIHLTDDSCVYMFSFTGSGSDIVIISLTDDSCVHIYTAVISERNDNNIRTTSCKREHTHLSSVRGMITISEPLPVKGENIHVTDDSCVYIFSFYRKWF
jgi:uncharacterized protein YihD (DUF1040 family)